MERVRIGHWKKAKPTVTPPLRRCLLRPFVRQSIGGRRSRLLPLCYLHEPSNHPEVRTIRIQSELRPRTTQPGKKKRKAGGKDDNSFARALRFARSSTSRLVGTERHNRNVPTTDPTNATFAWDHTWLPSAKGRKGRTDRNHLSWK